MIKYLFKEFVFLMINLTIAAGLSYLSVSGIIALLKHTPYFIGGF